MGVWGKVTYFYRRQERFWHLLVGLPSYDRYLEHMAKNHPDKIPKTRKEFFIEVQEARYGSNGTKKC
ncbi:hypothetical protein BKH46_06315 [Helicobacter sp. 12S02634-8]|uniref:KCU-star family selenoprotein n=1 Tax=Helicobacter sp. 12S02634-8 TaxID=1476199 RepID=UPI000BA72C35|nr:KCU-star family selenoprotein [Helicobacter sp. 12S02634-8]PAF46824.1 hypothetical protein BKH46_06315 [Helicobacter sp. 12S02634-8]